MRCSTTSYLTVILLVASVVGQSHAQFATVINIPAEVPSIESMTTIDSNTQVNLFDGGSIGDFVHAGNLDGTSTNVEVNVFGGTVGEGFRAFSNSTVNIVGGEFAWSIAAGTPDGTSENVNINMSGGSVQFAIGLNGGSTLTMNGGRVREVIALDGSTVDVGGGFLSGSLEAKFGSTVTVSGGSVGEVESNGLLIVREGSDATVSGGVVRFSVSANASLSFSGGQVGNGSIANSGSNVTISGGIFREAFRTHPGSQVELQGGEFMLDGVPVSGAINLPTGSILTGTLVDGSAFAFSSVRSGGPRPSVPLAGGDEISDGTLMLTERVLPPPSDMPIFVPAGPAPAGLRRNEVLYLESGGDLGDYFTAVDSELNVDGGSAGRNTELVRASLNMSEGSIGDSLSIHEGSIVRIDNGSVGREMQARTGSTVRLSGGSIGSKMELFESSLIMTGGNIGRDLRVEPESHVRISGGSVGPDFVASRSVVEVSGGALSELQVRWGSTITISGGLFGNSGSAFRATADDVVHIVGREFVIDGVDITESLPIGQKVSITDWSESISGTLADGNTFDFVQTGSCRLCFGLSPSTMVTVTLVPEPSCLVLAIGAWLIALAPCRYELARSVRQIHRSTHRRLRPL